MKQPGDQQADRDIFNIDNKGTVTVINQPVPQRSRSESLLIQAVKQEVISRLDQSLHNAVFINLGKQSQPQQVKRSWDAEIKIGSQSPKPLPTETTILEVFDRPGIDGRLLILGEPGAGKTTTMLDLAKALCDRAEQDATAFIPVLLNLSSWKDSKQTITAWLVEELRSKYGVRKDIGRRLLVEKQLLPLLDGLDEVKLERQESYVQAINELLQGENRPLYLVACSRQEEYEAFPEKLQLHGAICLKALTDVQIQTYLSEAGWIEFWQILKSDAALLRLMRTPLLLSVAILSYQNLSLERWQEINSIASQLESILQHDKNAPMEVQKIEARQTTFQKAQALLEQTKKLRLQLLLDAYVQRMLSRESANRAYKKCKPPKSEKTFLWLWFLAKQLQGESQTEFLIDKMQPSWLAEAAIRKLYREIFFCFFGSIFTTIFLVDILEDSKSLLESISFVGFNLSLGTLLGLAVEAVYDFANKNFPKRFLKLNKLLERIQTVEIFQFSNVDLYQSFFGSLNFRLIFLLVATVVFINFLLSSSLAYGVIYGLTYGAVLLIFSLIDGLKSDFKNRISANQGVRASAINALILLSTSYILFRFGKGFIAQPIQQALGLDSTRKLLDAIQFFALFSSFYVGGGQAAIKHFSLRLSLYLYGCIPWNYARFLDYCTERLFLQRVGGRYRFIHGSLI